MLENQGKERWAMTGSNCRHLRCKRDVVGKSVAFPFFVKRMEREQAVNQSKTADHLRPIFEPRDFFDRARLEKAKPGRIYFVTFGEGGPVKIGFSTNVVALQERLRGLQTACPYELVKIADIAGSTYDEWRLHDHFKEHSLRGEWFEPHPDILAEIDRLRGEHRQQEKE